MPPNTILCAATMVAVTAGSAAVQATNYDESIHGDLSSNGNFPTQLMLTAGTNSVIASMPGSDFDFLTVNIPSDHVLSALTLVSYVSTDGTSFIGMKNGTRITPTSAPADLNGYTHFGTGPGNVGQDILDDIGSGAGSVGFTPPLPSGYYSFWIQQDSSADTSYQFNFTVSPLAPPGLPGDYNGNNVVDAADYVIWRKMLNQSGPDLAADGDGDETVDGQDYTWWRERFGDAGQGSAFPAPVPEPASLPLVVLTMFSVGFIRLPSRLVGRAAS